MANQTNYKRTVAGSVGAGMGAIFNGAGRTYYILEHKTNSQYHYAGESQKIIIDQIELGRDSSCQVRFDESFDTVSRKHAAIVRDGQNWQLIHLSTSNPTLVNGRPIDGSYYLQSGDEIQLSVGGPRLGFIVPQGKQALTSSIKLTERMNLFRQQALAPYRRAIWTLAILLLLTIAGFIAYAIWTEGRLNDLKQERDILTIEMNELAEKINSAQANKDSLEIWKKQYAAKAQRREIVTQRIVHINPAPLNPSPKVLPSSISFLSSTKELSVGDEGVLIYEVQPSNAEYYISSWTSDNDDVVSVSSSGYYTAHNPGTATITVTTNNGKTDNCIVVVKQKPGPGPSSADVRAYYPNIYRIIIDDIKLQYGGQSHDADIATEKIDCGTGFILDNGNFITARQNIQPWINVNGISPTGWRETLAKAVAMGFDVIIQFSAYSTNGPSSKITFSSRDFDLPEAGDIISATYTIDKNDWDVYQKLGFSITKEEMKRTGRDIKVTTSSNRAYAIYRNTGYPGIPANSGASQSMAGSEDIKICGYTSNNIHNLSAAADYHKTSTKNTDAQGGTIRLQDSPHEIGYLGAPAFIEKDGALQVVGVYVGQGRVVPISSCK